MKILSDTEKSLVKEEQIRTNDISTNFEIGDAGLEFLRTKISKINQKAFKWNIPEIKLNVISERNEEQKKIGMWGEKEIFRIKKIHTVSIQGDIPKIDGFSFVGKVEHTPSGENILNLAPGASIKSFPDIFKTIKGNCDACHQNRERFNTFVLKLDKESNLFPNKKKEELIQVGSACLKKFLPGISVDSLINYAKIIEDLREVKSLEEKNLNDTTKQTDIYRNHISTDTFLKYVILTYLANGKFVSKREANSSTKIATSEEAIGLMLGNKEEYGIYKTINDSPALLKTSQELHNQVSNWMKQTNFNDLGSINLEYKDYYHNLNVLSKSPSIHIKNAGYFASILSVFLRLKNEEEKRNQGTVKRYVGQLGKRVDFHGKVLNKEKKDTAYGKSILYLFEDLDGNRIDCWCNINTPLDLILGERYSLNGMVKKHEFSKYKGYPITTITKLKVSKM